MTYESKRDNRAKSNDTESKKQKIVANQKPQNDYQNEDYDDDLDGDEDLDEKEDDSFYSGTRR